MNNVRFMSQYIIRLDLCPYMYVYMRRIIIALQYNA